MLDVVHHFYHTMSFNLIDVYLKLYSFFFTLVKMYHIDAQLAIICQIFNYTQNVLIFYHNKAECKSYFLVFFCIWLFSFDNKEVKHFDLHT